MNEKFGWVAKLITYVFGLIVLTLVIFRGLVGYLLASRSDFGVMGAGLVGLLGLLLLLWLATKAVQDLLKN
jgi:hypothetical protein